MIAISARRRDGGAWGDCEFVARSIESGIRTAARKLGIRGRVLTTESVGSEQLSVNVDGVIMMLVARETASDALDRKHFRSDPQDA